MHGFRGHDTNQALYHTASGKVVWFCAAVGIVYDKAQRIHIDLRPDRDPDSDPDRLILILIVCFR